MPTTELDNPLHRLKAITLHQPWASLIAIGAKRYETRGWPTNHRGPLAIHAAREVPRYARPVMRNAPSITAALEGWGLATDPELLPAGRVLAVVTVADCDQIARTEYQPNSDRNPWHVVTMNGREFWISDQEHDAGNWDRGRYAWQLTQPRRLTAPDPARGTQGLWYWHYDPAAIEYETAAGGIPETYP